MNHGDAIDTIKRGGDTLRVVVGRSSRQMYMSKKLFIIFITLSFIISTIFRINILHLYQISFENETCVRQLEP